MGWLLWIRSPKPWVFLLRSSLNNNASKKSWNTRQVGRHVKYLEDRRVLYSQEVFMKISPCFEDEASWFARKSYEGDMQLVRMQRTMRTGRLSYCSGLDIIGCLGLIPR